MEQNKKEIPCPKCKGRGLLIVKRFTLCSHCLGQGKYYNDGKSTPISDATISGYRQCLYCNGTRKQRAASMTKTCDICFGKGSYFIDSEIAMDSAIAQTVPKTLPPSDYVSTVLEPLSHIQLLALTESMTRKKFIWQGLFYPREACRWEFHGSRLNDHRDGQKTFCFISPPKLVKHFCIEDIVDWVHLLPPTKFAPNGFSLATHEELIQLAYQNKLPSYPIIAMGSWHVYCTQETFISYHPPKTKRGKIRILGETLSPSLKIILVARA